ncbi:MAG: AMP-binding protein [Tannerellaceae bacterium]|jgi:long-chain acyl-CoA synthetase|nr:AMP-binding protein [Tannerellaceae bacterium]
MENRFLGIVEHSLREYWDLPGFSDYRGKTYYYRDIARQMALLHILFDEAGIRKGDKIALVGRNSANWAVSFFGILSYGAVAVPILHDFKAANIHNIVNHSEAKALLAGAHNWEGMDEDAMPGLVFVASLEDFSLILAGDGLKGVRERWDKCFLDRYPDGFGPRDAAYHAEAPDEAAVLNYTSGTTSSSKGVMLPYRSLWSNTKYANEALPFIHAGDNLVCMLPMAHMYGLAFEILNAVGKGCHIHFLTRTPSPKLLLESFAELRPTLILAVPLIIEKMVKSRVFPQMEKPLMRFLLKLPVVKGMVLKTVAAKLNEAFGGNFAEIVIGGAALNREVESFLHSIGFRYTVGYGLTECGPLVAYSQWDSFKMGSVGRIVDRMEVRIDAPGADGVGEIFVRGDNVMLGYYKNPKATDAVMYDGGWMNTGDLGFLDKDGVLFIRGRSKTMILSSNGQNIYPEEIEDLLNNMPCVAESLIVYDEGKLTALIYPDMEKAGGVLGEADIMTGLLTLMRDNLELLNKGLPVYSKVASFKIQGEEFEKTPKRSIKRYLYQPVEG